MHQGGRDLEREQDGLTAKGGSSQRNNAVEIAEELMRE
jgi:hypothetical protein